MIPEPHICGKCKKEIVWTDCLPCRCCKCEAEEREKTMIQQADVPDLVAAADEKQRCCVSDNKRNRCPQKSRFWIGSNGVDDYTHVCGDHVADVQRDGDEVVKLEELT